MRWALVGVALLLAVAGLLYGGTIAFVSSLSEATAPRRVDGPGTVGATTGQVEARTLPAPSSTPQPGAPSSLEDSSPSAREQRILKSRSALETVNPRDLVRQATRAK